MSDSMSRAESRIEELLAKAQNIALGGGFAGTALEHVVDCATTAAIADLTNVASPIDGVALATGTRVLVRNQAVVGDNGVYVNTVVAGVNVFSRAPDWQTGSASVKVGAKVRVLGGTLLANSEWKVQTVVAGASTVFRPLVLSGTVVNFSGVAPAAAGQADVAILGVDFTKAVIAVTVNKNVSAAATTVGYASLVADRAADHFLVSAIKATMVLDAAGNGATDAADWIARFTD